MCYGKIYNNYLRRINMEEKYILSMSTEAGEIRYLIDQIIPLDGKNFFSLCNLTTGALLFGEYTGSLPESWDDAREIIWRDFLDGCAHISYPDGYILDDLYEMIDLYF